MLTVDLPERTVPAIGFGTWQLRGADCVEAVRHAVEVGYRHLDTARSYENEKEVGEGIRAGGVAREALFVTTKLRREELTAERVGPSVEASLAALGTDYVDLLLVHWPIPDVPLEETLHAMMRLADDGKVRLLGVSNFPSALWRRAAAIAPVVCNQVEYHPFLDQTAVLRAVRERGGFVAAYSPLARGRVAREPVLREIGAVHGKSASQVALRWLVQQDRVVALPKAASPEHRRTNLAIDDFSLSPEEMDRIATLARPDGRVIDPAWAPAWDPPVEDGSPAG